MAAESIEIDTPDGNANIALWARGGAVGLAGTVIGIALGLLWQFSLARTLGSAGLGNISLGTSVIAVLALLVALGMDSGGMRYVSFHHSEGDVARTAGVIRFTIGISLLSALLMLPVLIWRSNWIAVDLFKKPELANILRTLFVGLPLFTALQVMASILQGFRKIGTQLLVQQILVPLLRIVGLGALLFVRPVTAENVSVVIVVASALGVLAISVAVYREYPLGSHSAIKPIVPAAGLMKYSSQALLMSAVAEIGNGSQTFLLGLFASSSEIGIYAVAVKASMILGLFLTGLNLVAAPGISGLYAKGDIQEMHSLYQVITRWAFALTLPFFLMTVIWAREIMSIFGPEFTTGAFVLQLISLGQIVNVATGPCGWMLNMTNHQYLNIWNNFLALLVAGALSLALIPRYGAIGAAISIGASIALINILRVLEVYQVLHIHPYNASFLKPILACFAAGIVALGTQGMLMHEAPWQRLAVGISIIAAAYSVSMLALRLEATDRAALGHIFEMETRWFRPTPVK
jgi:O-antigen/teichoic acid export membrane protein